uniref:Uncharacterized protein n=1 Tax=Acanthochromis polyacanthus TaxID=80966 RepID=A0A3Q1FDX1_9TELE
LEVTGPRTCPDLGDPPSRAVRSKFSSFCFSRSSVFSSTSSALLSAASMKYSFFSRLYL